MQEGTKPNISQDIGQYGTDSRGCSRQSIDTYYGHMTDTRQRQGRHRETQGRHRADSGQTQGRHKADTGQTQGRHRADAVQTQGRQSTNTG